MSTAARVCTAGLDLGGLRRNLVTMIDSSVKELPLNHPVLLDNVTCWYCGRNFDEPGLVRTAEHAIARRFVPKGTLDAQWNLIGWACDKCNGQKADLENDLSAISMQPDGLGRYPESDDGLKSEAERKAKNSFSRRTRRSVKDSAEKITVRAPLAAGVEFEFVATTRPQADSHRIYELARLQVMAFFYWLTFDDKTRRGHFWRGGFSPVYDTIRSDWGNPLMRSFMDAVVGWEPRLIAITARGFYKVDIRKHPDAECWSWALEWNKQHRVIGFFGGRSAAEAVAKGLATPQLVSIAEGPNSFVRYHQETPLTESDDKLFHWDSDTR
jgi:hypothetical protein